MDVLNHRLIPQRQGVDDGAGRHRAGRVDFRGTRCARASRPIRPRKSRRARARTRRSSTSSRLFPRLRVTTETGRSERAARFSLPAGPGRLRRAVVPAVALSGVRRSDCAPHAQTRRPPDARVRPRDACARRARTGVARDSRACPPRASASGCARWNCARSRGREPRRRRRARAAAPRARRVPQAPTRSRAPPEGWRRGARGSARSGLTALALGDGTEFAPRSPKAPALARSRSWGNRAGGTSSSARIAYDVLRALLAGDAGEATAPWRSTVRADRGTAASSDEAARARARLAREYRHDRGGARCHRARAGLAAAASPPARSLQIGAFGEESRARHCSRNPRAAPVSATRPCRRTTPDGRATLYVVRLWPLPELTKPARLGERVQRAIGGLAGGEA